MKQLEVLRLFVFMISVSNNIQSGVIEAITFTSIYQDDFLNIDNTYFEQMVSLIYPTELQLNKTNYFDTEIPIFELGLVYN